MINDRKLPDDVSITSASPTSDPADEVPVPPAMSPAEIDERAQAVEAVRGSNPTRDTSSADEAIPPADA